MDSPEESQFLSQRKKSLLADLGVQVWHERRVRAASAETVVVGTGAPSEGSTNQRTALAPEHGEKETTSLTRTANAREVTMEKSNDTVLSSSRTEPAKDERASVVVERIEFSWVKNAQGLIICPLVVDGTSLQMLREVLLGASWVRSGSSRSTPSAVTQGEFQWPLLIESTGNPVRALTAFVDKHFANEPVWIGMTAETVPMLRSWLEMIAPAAHLKLIDLPELRLSLHDPVEKKRLWQTLRQSC